MMKRVIQIPCLCILLITGANSASANNTTERLEDFGDIMQFALPIAGWGATYLNDDKEGRNQFYKSYATAIGTTTVLKGVYGKLRPNSTSETSFPSGHTTSAFAGAAFIDQRYGGAWGTVAYTAAAITGYSRIRSENHFADDVIAGASVALMSNWYWVTPYQSDVMVAPVTMGDGVGVVLSVNESRPNKKQHTSSPTQKPKFRYELAMGGAALQKKHH